MMWPSMAIHEAHPHKKISKATSAWRIGSYLYLASPLRLYLSLFYIYNPNLILFLGFTPRVFINYTQLLPVGGYHPSPSSSSSSSSFLGLDLLRKKGCFFFFFGVQQLLDWFSSRGGGSQQLCYFFLDGLFVCDSGWWLKCEIFFLFLGLDGV